MFRNALKTIKNLSTRSAVTLPDLPYDYAALEPHISAEIMELHHSKHHQTYITNFNNMSEQLAEAKEKNDQATIDKISQPLAFNEGGYVNHCIFWENMSPNGGGELEEGDLKTQIIKDFGSVENMQTQLSGSTVAVQGSGWGWLGYDEDNKKLVVATTANQDILEKTTGLKALIGIDVWEHAYYLQYKNVRPDYVKNFWNVINWDDVSARFNAYK
jgi:Fe-Mn family superoxide dismutase